jgi:transcriptional regulator GlxA family with amidase domain
MSDQLQALAERVTALEAKLGLSADVPTAATDQRLSKKKLAIRWDTSDRSIDRRRKDDPDVSPTRYREWAVLLVAFQDH